MKNLFAFLLLSFLLVGSACNSNQATEQATEDETAVTDDTTMEETEEEEEEDKSQRPSPPREAGGTLGGAEVTVNYGSPSMRGREVWGQLVPYGQVWRTGANEATTITLSKDVMVEGKKLAAGRYALFTIPNQDKWTIIFNSEADQWGAYEYDQSKDALRVDVKPMPINESVEAMEFSVQGDQLLLRWEKVAVPIRFTAA